MNIPTIKAIETVFDGYKFRSRLEARWAVFFKTLVVPYEYEKEGYDLGEAGRYLPDFWLPTMHMWAEVKPEPLNSKEMAKAEALAAATQADVLLLVGVPRYIAYWAVRPPIGCCQFDDSPTMMDYLLDDQYLDENRWFCCPGLEDGEDASVNFWMSGRTTHAYAAARQARFEFGEHGR